MGCEAATVKLVSALVQVVSLKSTNEMGLETSRPEISYEKTLDALDISWIS